MAKTFTRKTTTAVVANAFEQALGKTDGKHYTLDNGKGKTEDFVVSRDVAAILSNGMTQATKLDNYWQENAQRIVAEFWGKDVAVAVEGLTQKQIGQYLRGTDDGDKAEENDKAYRKLFAALAQSSADWLAADRHEQAMNNHAKGSADYDDQKILRDRKRETARSIASRQAQTIVNHYARQMAKQDATSNETHEQLGARATIEATIADWNSTIAGQRGVYALAAERALLGAAVAALREVLNADRVAKNPQSLIATKPKVKQPAIPKETTAV